MVRARRLAGLQRLRANAQVAVVLGLIPASSATGAADEAVPVLNKVQ